MMNKSELVEAIEDQRVLVTNHAAREAREDRLKIDALLAAAKTGDIIEDYPDDRPCPSCLVLGFIGDETPVHSVWGYDREKKVAILITVYRPDPNRWINWRIRRT